MTLEVFEKRSAPTGLTRLTAFSDIFSYYTRSLKTFSNSASGSGGILFSLSGGVEMDGQFDGACKRRQFFFAIRVDCGWRGGGMRARAGGMESGGYREDVQLHSLVKQCIYFIIF